MPLYSLAARDCMVIVTTNKEIPKLNRLASLYTSTKAGPDVTVLHPMNGESIFNSRSQFFIMQWNIRRRKHAVL